MRFKRYVSQVILLCLMSHASLCTAQQADAARREPGTQSAQAEPEGGWVISAFIGGARTSASSLRISQPALSTELTFRDVEFEGRSFNPPLYYGLRGGYILPQAPFIGLEAEFIHLKVYADTRRQVQASGRLRGLPVDEQIQLGQVVQQYSISHGVNLLLFNVAGRYRLKADRDNPKGRLIFTARAGLGPTIPHTESIIEGREQQQYELGRLAWQLAASAEVRLWRGLYFLGEYKFTRTRQRGKVFSGEAESLLRTQQGVFGLSYYF